MTDTTQEQRWVDAARRGDEGAFESLVRSYEKRVFALAARMCGNPEDAAEAAQEAFLAAWQGLRFFRGDSSFSTWLYRLTANACVDLLRREGRHRSVAGPSLDDDGELNRDVPDSLTMTFGVYDNKHLYENQKPPAQSSVADYGVELLSDNPKEQREILATFTFELRFDPTYTEQGTVIDVGETFLLDGQSVTLTEAEIYPTHLRLNFDYDPANTAWLTELNFYLENERGERFNGIVNGISATGNPDDPSTDSVWLDSPYFSTGEHLTLHVTGASWIDKGQERVKVDLVKGMIEDPPQGVRLEWAEKRNAGWVVSFSAGARWEKTMHYQIWKNRFYDEDGTAHDINQSGTSSSPMILGEISGAELESYEAAEKAAKEEGRYFETFGLKDCTADCVWLEPCWTRITDSTAQVVIK